jgi:transposase
MGSMNTAGRFLRKQLKRDQVAAFFANMPPCLIGMEACGSAHHWARKLGSFGHDLRLMSPQFVKPYVKTNKPKTVSMSGKSLVVLQFARTGSKHKCLRSHPRLGRVPSSARQRLRKP